MQLTKFVRLAVASVLLASLTGVAGAAEPDGGWALATSKQKSTGRVIVFRYLNEFPAGFSRKAYPDRVILVWRYKSDMGMPQTEQRQRRCPGDGDRAHLAQSHTVSGGVAA